MSERVYFCPYCPWEGTLDDFTEGHATCPVCLADLSHQDEDDEDG